MACNLDIVFGTRLELQNHEKVTKNGVEICVFSYVFDKQQLNMTFRRYTWILAFSFESE